MTDDAKSIRPIDDLQQTKRQFWMPVLVAALVLIGVPVAWTVLSLIYWALTGNGGLYD